MFPGTGYEQQRLLPAHVEDRLITWAGRIGGVALLFVLACVWLSVLSWSLTDPSLTHATGGRAQNWIGPLGAIISDLLLQTLGFATALALLAPMFWGIELVMGERVLGFRIKAAFYPLSVLMIAGALSALPVSAGWPLHHGYGGILGDVLYNLGTTVFGLLNPDRAGIAAALLFSLSGVSAVTLSVGLQLRDWRAALTGPATLRGSWHQNLRSEAERLGRNLSGFGRGGSTEPAVPRPVDETLGHGRQPEANDAWAALRADPMSGSAGSFPDTQLRTVDPRRAASAPAGHDDDDYDAPNTFESPPPVSRRRRSPSQMPGAAHRALSFDTRTEDSSRFIAERFAPAGPHGNLEAASATAQRSAPKTSLLGGLVFRKAKGEYKRPSLNSLKRPQGTRPAAEFTQTVLRGNARLLEDVLLDFGVKGEVREIKPGPVVTLFELEPARGTKSSRVVALSDDIARSMSAQSVRVAVIPGRNAIGIELPNMRRDPVLLREILDSNAYRTSDAALPLALGKSIGGEPVVADLARMPHLLVAGTTGSGKSVGVNAMILSLLYRHGPETCRFLMIDPKMLELSVYNGIPHLLTPVVTDPRKAVSALTWVVAEMEERYKRMSKLSVRNIDVYNNRVKNAEKRGEMLSRTVQTGFDRSTGQALYERQSMDLEPMPYIVVVIDEFADLMIVAGKEIEALVQRLAQMARAAGIHLIMATQRPSVDVITGTIKANFPTRISFKVASKIDSRTILNDQGAEQLLGQGDMLYAAGSGQNMRVHGAFVADDEVESIAQSLREQGAPNYVEGILEAAASGFAEGDDEPDDSEDDLFDRAAAVVLRDRKASTSYIQRRLSIGYNRAADLIERMEREGLISPANHAGKREILAGGGAGGDPDLLN